MKIKGPIMKRKPMGEEIKERKPIIRINKPTSEYQFFCPYCKAEIYKVLSAIGEKGELACNNCKKKFWFTFGKVNSPLKFEGYNYKKGFLRMIVNGGEESIVIQTEKNMAINKEDRVIILWKRGLFNEYIPKEIIDYSNCTRTFI